MVLVAPPGAGKSTRLPLAALDEPWLDGGKIILVAPRRLAALGAARRMADERGEAVGETVGHRVRLDTKVSAKTRLEVVTDGVFTRMIADDPELSGVGLVMFDEVHERALQADLGLAFALESQAALRPDLRIMAMSATVDGARFEDLFATYGSSRRITSDGQMFPVATHFEPSSKDVLAAVIEASVRALRRFDGDGLIFLPGQREIEDVAGSLQDELGDQVAVLKLYGAVPRQAQETALKPDPQGRRKLVVASAIAETSLTIPGVRFVVDSGLARRPIYDPVRGVTRLETRPASRASLDQRRGRAGRLAPGDCIRLWRKEEEGGRPAQDRPEILDADLAPLRLDMAVWGATARKDLPFLDAPPLRAWEEAGRLLRELGALNEDGRPTALGKRMASHPTHPRLAAMLEQTPQSEASDAAWAAVLAEELLDRGPIAADERLAMAMDDPGRRRHLVRIHQRLSRGTKSGTLPAADVLADHLLAAYPDRVAKRQKDDGQKAIYKLAQGSQVSLATYHPLAQSDFLLVLDVGGGRSNTDRRIFEVRCALRVDRSTIDRHLGDRMQEVIAARFDPERWVVQSSRERRLGWLVLSAQPLPNRTGLDAMDEIIAHIGNVGLTKIVGTDKAVQAELARYQAFFEGLSMPAGLEDRAAQWLTTLLAQGESPPFSQKDWKNAFASALAWDESQAFARQWPSQMTLPDGRSTTVLYDHPAGTAISVRPQSLYGLDAHPTAGNTQLLIELLSPANRPIALTADLPAFWRAGWRDVRKDMRARYPKHDWPEEPWQATPTKRR